MQGKLKYTRTSTAITFFSKGTNNATIPLIGGADLLTEKLCTLEN